MKCYQEISLLPDAEIGVYSIWQILFQQIHLLLVENKTTGSRSEVGLSFPEYDADNYAIGSKLRLFAKNENILEQMECEKRLVRLKDYIRISPIRPVPNSLSGHACFKHKKPKGSKIKLARRRAKRKGETLQQALLTYKNYEERSCKLPYINTTSRTNGQSFRLFIEKCSMNQAQPGQYSCYGLSNQSTVPLF